MKCLMHIKKGVKKLNSYHIRGNWKLLMEVFRSLSKIHDDWIKFEVMA